MTRNIIQSAVATHLQTIGERKLGSDEFLEQRHGERGGREEVALGAERRLDAVPVDSVRRVHVCHRQQVNAMAE